MLLNNSRVIKSNPLCCIYDECYKSTLDSLIQKKYHLYGVLDDEHDERCLKFLSRLINDVRLNPDSLAETLIHNELGNKFLDQRFGYRNPVVLTGFEPIVDCVVNCPRFDVIKMLEFALRYYDDSKNVNFADKIRVDIHYENRVVLKHILRNKRVRCKVEEYTKALIMAEKFLASKLPVEMSMNIESFIVVISWNTLKRLI